MDFDFNNFNNKDILLFCGPNHLFDSTSFFLMKKLSINAKRLIIVSDALTNNKIPKDFKNIYKIKCAWWDLSTYFSNLKLNDKELLSQCYFDYVFTPLPIFPILNAITHTVLNKKIMIYIYEQGKPNITIRSFKKDFEIRDKIRVVKIIKKLKFDFLQYNFFLNLLIDLFCKARLRIKVYLNYLDLKKNSFKNIPKPLFNPYSGEYNISSLRKYRKNILNSSLVIQWNQVDCDFYKSIGFNNLKVIDHPAKEFILEKKDSDNVVLGIYPTEMTIENYKKLNVDIIELYVQAIKKIVNKFNVNKIRIKLKPNVINSDFSNCLSEELENLKIKQLSYEKIDSKLGIIESLQYDDIILGDFSSCLWLSSNIFSKKVFVLDELNLLQVEEMLKYNFINKVSEI